ncbi:Clp protease N-terminal domain-containing protein [Streptomyces genisteinicus]|uniref:Peptidase n=1 Tax=Streptomyces genisteinicus TaxID=2768068 RepID=A0A7H0I370_9ACTN|nr:Clp protease N-terminal domain-containing protein [Streptomyces genisteinicus]QNP67236.1 peptidase [Streptomyces genisteinicus]
MHHSSPRVPRQPAPGPAGTGAGLTDELGAVVAGARRRALRDGDPQIDTAHLLHSLLEADPEVRDAVGDGPQVARVLGYLVQRSIGYGLRWQGSVEDSGALRVIGRGETGWSPSVSGAMRGAMVRAGLRGEPHARCLDVLACIAADPDCRAVEVLRRAGVDAAGVVARIAEASRHASPR